MLDIKNIFEYSTYVLKIRVSTQKKNISGWFYKAICHSHICSVH